MPQVDVLLQTIKAVTIAGVRADEADLTARQLSIFLLICQVDDMHTVRGTAARVGVSKPAVTRAADRMEGLGLLRRKPDPRDRRSVLLTLTPNGHAAFRRLTQRTAEAWLAQGEAFGAS